MEQKETPEKETPENQGKDTPREKARKLGWLGNKEKDREKAPISVPGGLSQILMSGIISIVMALVVVFLVSPMKGDLKGLSEDLDKSLALYTSGLDAKLTNYQTMVSNEVAGLGTQIGGFDSRISGVESKVAAFNALEGRVDSAIAGIGGKVDTIVNAELTDLEDRIEELEANPNPSPSPSPTPNPSPGEGGVVVDLGYSNYPFMFSGNATTTARSIAFKVINTLDTSVENVELQLVIYSRGEPISFATSKVTSGWPLQWTCVYADEGLVVFSGISPPLVGGLRVTTLGWEDVYLTLALTTKSPTPIGGVMLYTEVEIKSYTIVE